MNPARPTELQPPEARRAVAPLHLLALCALLVGTALLPAQAAAEPAASDDPRDWRTMRTWSSGQGLPQTTILSLLREDSGHLWLGTEVGPARFDGKEFEAPDYSQHPDLIAGGCIGLAELGDDAVAALVGRGQVLVVDRFDIDAIHSVAALEDLDRAHNIRWIAGFADDGLALGTEHGLFRWQRGSAPTRLGSPACTAPIQSLAEAPRGGVWVGTEEGAYLVGPDGQTAPCVPGHHVLSFAPAAEGDTWIGTLQGLLRIDASLELVGSPANGLPDLPCHRLASEAGGDLLILGDAGRGLLLPDGDPERGLVEVARDRDIRCIEASSADRCFWLGTDRNGLVSVAQQPVRQHLLQGPDRLSKTLTAVLVDAEGTVWAGTGGNGLYRLGNGREDRVARHPAVPADAWIHAFHEDRSGALWIGGRSLLGRLTGDRFEAIARTGIPGAAWIRTILEGPGGRIWLGTSNGLFRQDSDGWHLVELHPRFGSDVWSLCHDGEHVYAGTRRGGVFEVGASGASRLPLGHPLDKMAVTSLLYAEGALWIGTLGGRLARHTGTGLQNIPLTPGFRPTHVLGLQQLAPGRLWVSCNGGLILVDISDPDRGTWPMAGIPVTSIQTIDALSGHSGNALAVDAERGRIFATGVGALVEVGAEGAGPYRTRPIPGIRRVLADGIPLALDQDEIVVPAGTRRLLVHYSIDQIPQPEQLRYRSRLRGALDTWREPPPGNPAVFTQLGAGSYTFECESGVGMQWNGGLHHRTFRVLPTFGERTEVRVAGALLAILLVALACWGFHHNQRRRAHELELLVSRRTAALAAEIELKEAAEAALRRSHDDLDRKVRERTAELEATSHQLIQAQKLESVARLAGGLAHDLNNLLTAILGFAETAAESLPRGSTAEHDLREIRRASHRAAGLVARLLSFARPQPIAPQVLDLRRLIRELEPMLTGLLRPDRSLRVEMGEADCPVLGDPGQLEQVLTNLVVNARDATPPNGPPIVVRAGVACGPETCAFEVRDQGRGIAPVDLERIFDPFFTTREEGNGLGLSVCHGIIRQANGRIEVESTPGEGTSFTVHLPRTVEQPAQDQPEMARGEEGSVVLVVDDQRPVRTMLGRALRQAGFEVLEAEGVEDALDRSAPDRLLAVVTDVMMPGGSGDQLVERLRRDRPDLPALYVTGFTARPEQLAVDHVQTDLLFKPFGPEELVERLQRLLNRSKGG